MGPQTAGTSQARDDDGHDLIIDTCAVLDSARPGDCVVFCAIGNLTPSMRQLAKRLSDRDIHPSLVRVWDLSAACQKLSDPIFGANVVSIVLPRIGLLPGQPCMAETALKAVINATSTIGFIHKGCVYRNRMINLNISNLKLLDRATRIVSEVHSVGYEFARTCVLRAIYMQDTLDADCLAVPDEEHVKMAKMQEQVVPRAILLSSTCQTVDMANAKLQSEHIIRNLLTSND